MISVALKGLLGRKTRAILTALAIVLGTGMVSATFIFTDTLNQAFTGVFAARYEQSSVVVSGKQIVTGGANTPSVPASLVARIRAVPGVEAASGGFLFATVKLVGANGKAIGNGGPQFGLGVAPAAKRFTPLALTGGRWPAGPGEIAIGAVTAAKEHYAVGDAIGAKGTGGVHRYTITGLAEIPGVSAGSATLAAFDVGTAQVLLGKQGRYDSISVVGSPAVTPLALAARIRPLLSETEMVRTSAAEAASVNKSVTGGIGGIKYILLAFAGIALFVGAFVIFNAISMTVAQRTRELATLRTLGASRRQVLRSVLLESAVIGALASLLGLVLGLGLFKGLEALFTGLPQAGTVFAAQTVVVTIVLGTGITLLAGLFPALRATRVPPIAAVREGAVLPVGRFHRYKPYVAGFVIVLAVLALALVTFVAVLASGLESSTKDDLTRQVRSDYVVVPDTSTSATFFDAATGPALASVTGVTSVSAVRSDNARVLGSTVSVNGIDGATIAGVYRFAWKDGSNAVLADLGNGAIVDSKWAKTRKLSVGSPFQVQASNGTKRTFVVRATYHPKFQAASAGTL